MDHRLGLGLLVGLGNAIQPVGSEGAQDVGLPERRRSASGTRDETFDRRFNKAVAEIRWATPEDFKGIDQAHCRGTERANGSDHVEKFCKAALWHRALPNFRRRY